MGKKDKDLQLDALRKLVSLDPQAMYNAIDQIDDDDPIETKRAILLEHIEDEALSFFVNKISIQALRAFVNGEVKSEKHLIELSKMFDFAGVENQIASLLRVLVPGRGYKPIVDENVRLPVGVTRTSTERTLHIEKCWLLEAFVEYKAENWIHWLLEANPDLRAYLGRFAAKHGNLDLLRQVYESKQAFILEDTMLSTFATEKGHLHILQFLYEQKVEMNHKNLAFWACTNGHIHVMDWLLEKNFAMLSPALLANAALRNQFDLVRYYHARGVQIDHLTKLRAKELGHLDLLRDPPTPSDFIRSVTEKKKKDPGHVPIKRTTRIFN
mmetsp:Transcript_15855/g.23837  ORF Transcript_15855/g.23837 Transcript_15855/m.23837 type:complete len:326 (-) Transcript_15855:571-1548(-)